MANSAITKGSIVEVIIDEPGFHGSWYVATVIDKVDASPTKKRSSNKKNRNLKKIGYLVKYLTLLKEGSLDEALTEIVDPSFVRPMPPCNLRRDGDGVAAEDDGGDFEVYDVVDVYHREGWWVGVVKKVIGDGDLRKYVVLFENPAEEVEFEKLQVRLHADWIGGRWVVRPKKTPEPEVVDRNATHTSDDAHSGFITPSKGTLKTDIDNLTVDLQLSAKMKSHLRKNTESNSEMAGAVDASVPSSRKKRIMNPLEEDSHGKRLKSSSGSKGKTKVKKNRSYAVHQNSPLMEHAITTTERKRGRPPNSLAKRSISLAEGGHEITTYSDEQPLSPVSASSCHRDESLNQATVTGGGTTDYQHDWPFIKRSPAWATILSLELYQTPPQKPHFSPLKKTKEDCREGVAVAMMVTFGNLVQRLSDIQLTDPVDIINDKLETLADLETYGFDVGVIRGRLNEFLTLKSKVGTLADKLKKVEEEIEKCNGEKCLEEKEINELEVKMQELQEKMARAMRMKKAKEEKIVKLQSNLHLVSEQITDWELAFKKLAASPLKCR